MIAPTGFSQPSSSATLVSLLPGGETYQNGVGPGRSKLAQFREVLRLRCVPDLRSQSAAGDDAVAFVRLFDPCGSWEWFITEWDGDGEIFALVNGHRAELGYVFLEELSAVRGPTGIGIEIDMHFVPTSLRSIRAKL